MKVQLLCKICGSIEQHDLSEIPIRCPNCLSSINPVVASVVLGEKLKQVDQTPTAVLEKGSLVVLDNQNHVWNGSIALICEVQHKFYRIELHGTRILVPQEWVKPI